MLAEISPSIAEHGTFNFCLSNGQALFTYATTKLHWLVREYPFKPAQLIDIEVEVDFSQVTTPEDRVAVITTEPLTQNEEWTAFQEGEMIFVQRWSQISFPIDTCRPSGKRTFGSFA